MVSTVTLLVREGLRIQNIAVSWGIESRLFNPSSPT
jgi:hypothetical protein